MNDRGKKRNCTSSNHNFLYTRRGRGYGTDFCQGLQILHLGFLFQRLKHNNTDFRQKKESLSGFGGKHHRKLKIALFWKNDQKIVIFNIYNVRN